jgi:hypothetical protein
LEGERRVGELPERIPFFAKTTAEEIVDRRFPLARVSTDGRAATFRHLGFFTIQIHRIF